MCEAHAITIHGGKRKMTRREREVTDMKEITRILEESKIVHIGLCDGDQPYVLPMNYGYVLEDGELILYLHGAKEGYKYDVIRKNPKVSFEMECDVVPFEGRIACQYGTTYASIIGKGRAIIIDDVEEKIKALSILMKTQTGKDFTFDEKLVSIVNVIKITASEYTAKKRPMPAAMPGE